MKDTGVCSFLREAYESTCGFGRVASNNEILLSWASAFNMRFAGVKRLHSG